MDGPLDRGCTQIGGEGASWVGESGFSTRNHIFQNLGAGAYNHSGSLALHFAVGAGVNITYKIAFNDAVAMTGGQPKYPAGTAWPAGTTVHHRSRLIPVQEELANIPA
jgi:indolepyruvate ferredoxin oxidoreductase